MTLRGLAFDTMLAACKERGIRVVLDGVRSAPPERQASWYTSNLRALDSCDVEPVVLP